ncbi:MAG: enoyl-CoA hydratase/isomerase family protein, partial [Alphaproteobacteria bacterium]
MEFVSTKIEDRVAEVTFSRGDDRNALSVQAMEELRDTARALAENPDLMAVILSSKGAFSAGADLKDTGSDVMRNGTMMEKRQHLKLGPDMCDAWENIEAYTIVAMEGYCIGGGSALAAAIDYRILGRSAHMRLPEVPLGMNMSWHSVPRLVAQIGPARAKQYITLGERVYADQALSWGLVEEVVDDGTTLDAARAYAQRITKLPPLPVRMTKQSVNAAAMALANATTFMDRDQYMLAVSSSDFRESVKAFFEKRDPEF